MKDVDALLFDLGGVIIQIDFDRAFTCWAKHANCAPAVIASRFSPDAAYEAHERGEITSRDYFTALRKSLEVNITDDQFRDGWNAIFVGTMPGISATLKHLAATLPIYAFSNSNVVHEHYWSRAYADTLGHFSQIYVSSSLGLRKPEAAAFNHVVSEIGVPAQRIVFFDDLAENITAARLAGLRAAHVPTGPHLHKALLELGLG